ncbi:hypothetical protein Hypma_011286 [Hypsizygus marmoreus]|uniref:Uncharacterized protein n=1 Tax=Hypsizygus marmoreus TaxID=39966 RepID=A0A369JPN7_HYPMA|nr:hypothetical protein Hypma_011286 [Hypsizygus marmoreus]
MLGIWFSLRHSLCQTVRRKLLLRSCLQIHGRGYASRGAKPKRIISTLHRDLIQDSDFLDISHVAASNVCIPKDDPYSPIVFSQIRYFRYFAHDRPFPDNCRGFLYYHRDPHLPAISGTVRFRLTPDARASSFSAGTDLLLPDRPEPWSVWLAAIANAKTYDGFLQLLRKDSVVSPSLLELCKNIGANQRNLGRLHHTMLFTLGQPFVFDVDISPTISVIWPHGIEQAVLTFTTHTVQRAGEPFHYHPYKGQFLARFERSLSSEHAGRRVVVLRILEIIKPITLAVRDFHVSLEKPTAGSLLTRDGIPLAIDVDERDSQVTRCLRLLVEAS